MGFLRGNAGGYNIKWRLLSERECEIGPDAGGSAHNGLHSETKHPAGTNKWPQQPQFGPRKPLRQPRIKGAQTYAQSRIRRFGRCWISLSVVGLHK